MSELEILLFIVLLGFFGVLLLLVFDSSWR